MLRKGCSVEERSTRRGTHPGSSVLRARPMVSVASWECSTECQGIMNDAHKASQTLELVVWSLIWTCTTGCIILTRTSRWKNSTGARCLDFWSPPCSICTWIPHPKVVISLCLRPLSYSYHCPLFDTQNKARPCLLCWMLCDRSTVLSYWQEGAHWWRSYCGGMRCADNNSLCFEWIPSFHGGILMAYRSLYSAYLYAGLLLLTWWEL